MLEDDAFRFDANHASSAQDIQAAVELFLARADDATVEALAQSGNIFAAVQEESLLDKLKVTGKFAGGMRSDLGRRLKVYWSDWTVPHDRRGILKYLSTIFLLYSICLLPAIAFGNLYSQLTSLGDEDRKNADIGVMESMLGQAIAGLIFSVFGGQPMLIFTTNGPLAVYTGVMFQWSRTLDCNFLAFYGWVDIWAAIILLFIAVFDLAAVARYCTLFTQEVYELLVSIIFIYEAVHYMVDASHDESTSQFLMTMLLVFGTTWVGLQFVDFRRSHYVSKTFRILVADFGAPIAVILGAGFAAILNSQVSVPKVPVPSAFGIQTSNGRAWLAPLGDLAVSKIFLALIPAILFLLLFFVDHHITGMIISRPDFKLRKGPAFHWDLFVAAIILLISAVLGLPFANAAFPQSPMHIRALADVEEFDTNGQVRSRIIKARETRLVTFIAHVLILLTFIPKVVLTTVPIAVLYGLFMYMGWLSLEGNEFYERLKLYVTDPAKYPPNHYVRKVPIKIIHLYTLLQALCFGVVWVIQANFYMGVQGYVRPDLFYPVAIVLCIVVHGKIMPLFMNPAHLLQLGSEEFETEYEF